MRLKFMVADIVQRNLRKKCNKCKEKFRLQVIQKIDFNAIVKDFRFVNAGMPFSQVRWRKFFKRRQVFETLCMECAYIENLLGGNMGVQDQNLRALMANNALKMQGAGADMVARKIQQPFMKRMILYWLWQARASLLHKDNDRDLVRQRKVIELR